MIFIGNIEAKTDDKGRVFVPAAYRKQLQNKTWEGWVIKSAVTNMEEVSNE